LILQLSQFLLESTHILRTNKWCRANNFKSLNKLRATKFCRCTKV